MRIQEHMMCGLLSLGPDVQPVVFTDDPYYLSLCQEYPSLLCISEFQTNQYGLPYIRSFMSKLDSLPSVRCHYQGYVNGDILLSHTLLRVLRDLEANPQVKIKRLLVGRRTNYLWTNMTHFPDTIPEYESMLQSVCSNDAPYMSNAVVSDFASFHSKDLFIYTPGTFDYQTMRGIVVGRVAVDGYLISTAKEAGADLVDLTEAVCVVHMTDSRGNKAGEQGNRGKSINNVKWNENPSVCGPNWLARFKRRSIATSVGNSDWAFCSAGGGD